VILPNPHWNPVVPYNALFRLWCDRYISGLIQDQSIILIGIPNPGSPIITWTSVLDQPWRLVHPLLTSPVPGVCIDRPMTVVWPSTGKLCIIWRSVRFLGSPFSIVTSHQWETLILVAEQMTIHSCSNGSFLMSCVVVNIKLP
jgi:hypothetical protein